MLFILVASISCAISLLLVLEVRKGGVAISRCLLCCVCAARVSGACEDCGRSHSPISVFFRRTCLMARTEAGSDCHFLCCCCYPTRYDLTNRTFPRTDLLLRPSIEAIVIPPINEYAIFRSGRPRRSRLSMSGDISPESFGLSWQDVAFADSSSLAADEEVFERPKQVANVRKFCLEVLARRERK